MSKEPECCDHCKENPNDQCPAHYKVCKFIWRNLTKMFKGRTQEATQ